MKSKIAIVYMPVAMAAVWGWYLKSPLSQWKSRVPVLVEMTKQRRRRVKTCLAVCGVGIEYENQRNSRPFLSDTLKSKIQRLGNDCQGWDCKPSNSYTVELPPSQNI